MTSSERRLMALWTTWGLLSEGIGPEAEWHPVPPDENQERHQAYWSTVSGMMPDDEHDEPFWMTQAATARLLNN